MIKVYFDTNMLENYAGDNLIISNNILSEKFYNFTKQVAENVSLNSAMTIIIPQVVVDEISFHIKETFESIQKLTSKISQMYKMFDVKNDFILKEDEEKVLSKFYKEIELLAQKYPFIALEKHKNTINNVYYKALNKLSPFYKKNPKLDSGFKDAVLWKTAVENQGVAKVVICTSDDDFDGCGIEVVKTYERLIDRVQKEYLSKKELIESFIKDQYIKERIIDELGYKDTKNVNLELLGYLETDDPQFYDFEVVKIKATIDTQVIVAEFNINMPANEVELSQLIEDGE